MNTLDPKIGRTKWRNCLQAKFESNADRCTEEAKKLTNPDEKACASNLAQLWLQLAEAARSQPTGK